MTHAIEEPVGKPWQKPLRNIINKYVPEKRNHHEVKQGFGKIVPQDLFRWRLWLSERGYDLWSPMTHSFVDYIREISEGESPQVGQTVTVTKSDYTDFNGITGVVTKQGEGGVFIRHFVRKDTDTISFFFNKELV